MTTGCILKRLGRPHKSQSAEDDWDIIKQSLCRRCRHFKGFTSGGKPHCKAFPNGIPDKFWNAKVDHTVPYTGDNGITFEP